MTDEAEKPEQQQVRKGLSVDMPGFEGEVSEDTAKTFMQYTGQSWRWVVKALAFTVFWCGFCWGLSWLL